MKSEQLVQKFLETVGEMGEIVKAKNADYGGGEAWKNFEMVQHLGIADAQTAFLVRMTDKITRISNLIHQDAKVKYEAITDTLLDLANYSILLKIYIDEQSQKEHKKERKWVIDEINLNPEK